MKKRNLALAVGAGIATAAAVKLLTRAAGVEWDDVSSFVAHSDRSKFIEIDGTRIHYQSFGDAPGPAMVLIHGYTASTYVWKTTAPLLAGAGFHVIAVDLVGFGYSAKPADFEYTIKSQARMVLGLMKAVGIDHATLVGSSYGGAVAMTIALDEPNKVNKLVLVGAVCNDDLRNHPVLRLVSCRGIGEFLTPFLADSKLFLRRRMHSTLARANHHLIDDQRIAAIRRPLCSREGHRSLLATSRGWSAAHIEENLARIQVPTLIIWGEDDAVVPIKNAHKMHDQIPNARLVVLKDCGHVPPEEKPDSFVELVAEFSSE